MASLPTSRKIAVITGAGAGVGRAVTRELARRGCDVALLSRDPARLEAAAAEARALGVRALPIPTDVADSAAMDEAASRIEAELGPIAIWVNVAMATVFAPVSQLTAAEIKRATEVTYLGQVHGMLAALRVMRPRRHGSIVNVGSALAYRSVPLQSPYCGAKAAIRGFTDSLRSELLHDRMPITVSVVDLPAINTPQFDWARNKTGHKARPVPPIFEPEVAARAIADAALHPRRETLVGWPTVKALLGNALFPGLLDRYLANFGYSGQMEAARSDPASPGNLFEPVAGDYAARGRFAEAARTRSWEMAVERHGHLAAAGLVGAAAAAVYALLRSTSHAARPRH